MVMMMIMMIYLNTDGTTTSKEGVKPGIGTAGRSIMASARSSTAAANETA